ncbi:MAG TPA: hypothetical protein VK752_20055 [Bryobacteraceae bacterium]|nr:hypothetical protein [Bryobacteraceae bacterium]
MSPQQPVDVDQLTVASLGILAYILGNIIHEGLGHGGACLITGGRPLLITAVNMECSADNRFVIAGGSLMNAIAAAVFFVLGRAIPRSRPHLKYFVWLAMTLNLLSPAGYLAFSGIGGFGDWAQFIQGFQPQWAWRVALTIAGSAAYMLFVRWSLFELRPLIGSDPRGRVVQAFRLSIAAYFAGGTVECIAGAFNPQGWLLIALSAAASTFGGSSALLWSPNWLRGKSIPPGPDAAPIPIERSWPIIIAAAIVAITFIALLGPGLHAASI